MASTTGTPTPTPTPIPMLRSLCELCFALAFVVGVDELLLDRLVDERVLEEVVEFELVVLFAMTVRTSVTVEPSPVTVVRWSEAPEDELAATEGELEDAVLELVSREALADGDAELDGTLEDDELDDSESELEAGELNALDEPAVESVIAADDEPSRDDPMYEIDALLDSVATSDVEFVLASKFWADTLWTVNKKTTACMKDRMGLRTFFKKKTNGVRVNEKREIYAGYKRARALFFRRFTKEGGQANPSPRCNGGRLYKRKLDV